MGNVSDKLNFLARTKEAIKDAILSKDVAVTDEDSFRSYADKIRHIPVPDPNKAVRFYDYDGTLLHSYTIDEYNNLGANPPLPTHDGLVCLGWNIAYGSYIIEEYQYATIGACYTTVDGSTHIWVSIQEDDLELSLDVGGSVTVEWGDGDEDTSSTTVRTHVYSAPGNYVIKVDAAGGYSLGSGAYLIPPKIWNQRYYDWRVTRIYTGERCNSIYLRDMANLQYISFNNSHGWVNIQNCPQLECILSGKFNDLEIADCSQLRILSTLEYSYSLVRLPSLKEFSCGSSIYYHYYSTINSCPSIVRIPQRLDFFDELSRSSVAGCSSLTELNIGYLQYIKDGEFKGCKMLKRLNVEEGSPSPIINYIGAEAFSGCISLRGEIVLSSQVTKILENTFYECWSLDRITVLGTLKEIEDKAFYYCSNLQYLDLSNSTAIPYLHSDVFTNSSEQLRIIVPDNLYESWIVNSSWKKLADKIITKSEYEEQQNH